jgi:dihydroorotase
MRRPLAIGVALLACGVLPAARGAAQTYDLVLRGGTAIDPETGLHDLRDIGIDAGAIAYVGPPGPTGREELDVTGLVVSPGFIDLHVHGQNPLSYDFMARDGVTTALDLELGAHGVADFLSEREGAARIHYGVAAGHIPSRVKLVYGISGGHPATRSGGVLGSLVRLLQSWIQPTRFATEPADAAGIAELVAILEEQLDQGGIGIGMGLEYTPGATPEEVRAVFALAARRGVPVFVHLAAQQTPTDQAPLDAILAHARATRASLHIVHIASSSLDAVDAYLAAVDRAAAEGLDVSTEVYPYTAFSTFIESELFSEGWRERKGMDYGDLQWTATGERLTQESFERYRRQGGTVIGHAMKEANVRKALAHPRVMIASDGMAMYDGGEHPRSAGTHARVLGRYVREEGVISLPDAVAKLTLQPARRLERFVPGMQKKGRLQVGADADLTVFDPKTVLDRASYEDSHQPSAGIPHVLVGGAFVVRDGALVEGALPGQAVRAGGGI